MMKDMDKAVEIIANAVLENNKIRVVGDYDIDGVCAAAILVRAFKEFGADVSLAHQVP